MTPYEDDNQLDGELARALGSGRPTPGFSRWCREHPRAVEMLRTSASRNGRGDATQRRRDHSTITGRIFTIKRISPLAAAIVIAAIAGVAIWLTSGNGGASVAWADVQDMIRNIRACTFKMKMTVPTGQEMWMDVTAAQGGLLRYETAGGEDETVWIVRFDEGKALGLMSAPGGKRIAMVLELGAMDETEADRFHKMYLLGNLSELIGTEPAVELGEKTIAGRAAKGYQVTTDLAELSVWVDAETCELIEMQMTVSAGPVKMAMTDFQFNQEVDEGLFTLEVPPGYEEPITIKQPSFSDVAILLGVMARMNGGVFPDALPAEPTMDAYMKPLKGFNRVLGADEAYRVVLRLGGGVQFLEQIQPAGRYVGKGVKYGDPQAAVFWYRPADSQTYKVIYGDLRIEDVAQEDLPQAPEQSATAH